MIDASVVTDVFESAVNCLSTLLSTSVGGWIGGCVVLIFILRFFKQFTNI